MSGLLSPAFELEYARRVYEERPRPEVDPRLTPLKAESNPHPIQELALQSAAGELLFGGTHVSDRQKTRKTARTAPRHNEQPVAKQQVPPWLGEAKR
ncbi:MAG: hypothetical protein OXI92_10355 [Acidobacteriota bacterium]|nr:hypothetical protein [Acidobacteriota bacterium]